MKIEQIGCVQGHKKKKFENTKAYGRDFLSVSFNILRLTLSIMKLTYIFDLFKIMKPTLCNMDSTHNLSTGTHKRYRTYKLLHLEISEGSLQVVLCIFLINLI